MPNTELAPLTQLQRAELDDWVLKNAATLPLVVRVALQQHREQLIKKYGCKLKATKDRLMRNAG